MTISIPARLATGLVVPLVASVALLLAIPASADRLYRWVDSDGRVHFGDRPPQDAAAEDLSGKLDPVNSADATTRRQYSSNQRTSVQRDYEENQRRQQAGQQQQRQRACKLARQRLRLLQGPVAIVDENGEEIRMSERERQQRAEAMARQVAQLCAR